MDKFYERLGERVRIMREERGLSQEVLAKLLGINRVALSQIENGERKISAEELSKFSKVFNTAVDVILDVRKDVKVIFEKDSSAKPPSKNEIRISVPQKNLNKFKEILLYILNKVGSKPNVGETVIYKLLYFIDFNFYEKYEEQLIGATYIKNTYGPTPVEFKKIIDSMVDRDIVAVKDKYFKYPQTKYLPLRKPDISLLSAKEIKMVDEVLEKLSDMNATEISDYSHKDVPWLTTEKGKMIEYESAFYRTAPYSMRSYVEE